jgi:hypothetical protein
MHLSMTRYHKGARWIIAICSCFILFSPILGAAQSIYKGGSGSGFSVGCFVQPNNPALDIYKGGIEDGAAVGCFIQPNAVLYDIYKGGIEDGAAVGCFVQPDALLYDIYKGGNEDGFAVGCFIQPSTVLYDIYKGGIEDGFGLGCFVQPSSPLYDIYKGGNGDGFTVFCIGSIGAEVPLPIQLLNFNGKYQDNTVVLQWKTASELNNDYFGVERSANGLDFVLLYKVPGAGTTAQLNSYSFTDEGPLAGINYYRLRQADYDGVFTYSPIISIYADATSNPSMTIFPNPSDNTSIVSIRMKGIGQGTPVELIITSVYGQVISAYEAALDNNGQIKLPASITGNLTSGLYIVSVRFSAGHLTTKWVVK